jgi:hypothetical protein
MTWARWLPSRWYRLQTRGNSHSPFANLYQTTTQCRGCSNTSSMLRRLSPGAAHCEVCTPVFHQH